MRVAIDGTALALASGGLRRYTEELHRALEATFPGDGFEILKPRAGRWWSLGLARRMPGFDLFHGVNFAVPYVPVRPSVMTVHDLSLWLDASWHPGPRRERARAPYLLGLGLATMVISPSQTVRRQAIEHFRLHPSRVVAIPEGTRMRRVITAPECPYLLYVGAIEPRKNLDFLLEVWREVRKRRPLDLVIAGRVREDSRPLDPEPGLRILGEVPDDELPRLYSGCEAFLYPSFYEGFGLPVIEALACGARVLTSTDPALVEVSGEAALHLDARNGKAWIEALLAPASRPAPVPVCTYTWERTARLTREVYEEAIRRF